MNWLLVRVSEAQSIKHFPRLSYSTEDLQKLLRAPPPPPYHPPLHSLLTSPKHWEDALWRGLLFFFFFQIENKSHSEHLEDI